MSSLYFKFPDDDNWYAEYNLILGTVNLQQLFGLGLDAYNNAGTIIIECDDGNFCPFIDKNGEFSKMTEVDFLLLKLKAHPLPDRYKF